MRFRKTLTFLILATGLAFHHSAWAQQKPFTQDQVQGMVRSGLGDESGTKLVEQRGIDFDPREDFLQILKSAGANEAFLEALRSAKRSLAKGQSAKAPLNELEIITLLAGQVPSHRVAILVKERGIDFDVKDDYLKDVRLGGGDDELVTALKSAKVTMSVTVPAASPQAAQPAVDPQTVTVYVTKTGKKYHREGCRSLSRSKIPMTLKEAKAKGYTPCSTCRPPQ